MGSLFDEAIVICTNVYISHYFSPGTEALATITKHFIQTYKELFHYLHCCKLTVPLPALSFPLLPHFPLHEQERVVFFHADLLF